MTDVKSGAVELKVTCFICSIHNYRSSSIVKDNERRKEIRSESDERYKKNKNTDDS